MKRFWLQVLAFMILLTPTLVTIDSFFGLFGRGAAFSTVTYQSTIKPDTAILVLPGIKGSGYHSAKALKDGLIKQGHIVGVNYARTEFDIDLIYKVSLAALQKLRPTKLVIYGQSLGGMVAIDWLRRYQKDGLPITHNVRLILESSPFEQADINLDWFSAMIVRLPGGPISSMIEQAKSWYEIDVKKVLPPTDGQVDPKLVQDGYRIAKSTDFRAISSQARFARNFVGPKPGELIWVNAAYYLHAKDDPLINVGQAYAKWQPAFTSLEQRVVNGWPTGRHSPLTEQPNPLAKEISGLLA